MSLLFLLSCPGTGLGILPARGIQGSGLTYREGCDSASPLGSTLQFKNHFELISAFCPHPNLQSKIAIRSLSLRPLRSRKGQPSPESPGEVTVCAEVSPAQNPKLVLLPGAAWTWTLKQDQVSESPREGLVEMWVAGPPPVSESGGLGRAQRICFSNRFLADVAAVGHWEPAA